jgi:PAS domain S-box-containing protein
MANPTSNLADPARALSGPAHAPDTAPSLAGGAPSLSPGARLARLLLRGVPLVSLRTAAVAGGLILLVGLDILADRASGSGSFAAIGAISTGALMALAWIAWAVLWRARKDEAKVFQERLENLVNGSLQGVVVHRDHRPLFANRAYAEMFGFASPAEVLAIEDLASLVSPEHRPMVVERARKRLAGQSPPNRYEFLGLRRDGRPIWVEVLSMVVPWSDGPAIQSTAIDITERRRAEEALRLSEMSYRSLFEANRRILENSPAGIVLLDRQLRVVYENPEARAIYGLAPKDFSGSIGRKLTEIEPLRGTAVTHVAGRLSAGRRAQLDTGVRNLRGEAVSLSIQAVPILEDERLAGAVILMSDVTERRRQEEALRKQDRLLLALAEARSLLLQPKPWTETLEQIIASLGRHMGVDHVVVFVHEGEERADSLRATLQHEWYAEGFSAYKGDPAFLHVPYRDSGFSRWFERFAQGLAVNSRIQDVPVTEKWLFEKRGIRSAIAVPIFRGKSLWGFIGCVDHREERQSSPSEESILQAIAESLGHRLERDDAEEKLRVSEEHFSRFLSHVPVMMFQYRLAADGSESFPYVSQVGLEALGVNPDEVKRTAEPMHDRIHPSDRVVYERLMKESLRTMSPKRWEGRYYNARGEQRWAELISRPTRQDNGDVLWDGFIMDVSGRKRAELEMLRARERDAAWNSSRELITEWAPVLREIEAELASRQPESAPGAGAAPAASARSALALVRRLIQQPAAAHPAAAPISLPTLLADAAWRSLHGTDIDYELDLRPDLDRVAADPVVLRDIFTGLMVAVLHAMPDGGQLTARADNVRIEGGGIAGLQPGYYVRVLLQGEPSRGGEQSPDGPAHRTGGASQGPHGLADVLGLVTAHRGWLTVHAQPGRGPLFTLYLPAATLRLVPGDEPEPRKPRSAATS